MTTKELELDAKMIVAAKFRHLAVRQEKVPMAAAIALATMQANPRPLLNIVTRDDPVTLIAQITHTETYDPVASALRYIRDSVDAVTLFTDGKIYSKGLDDLVLVSHGIRNHPVICQDYILNEYHVTEVRTAGASAVILYASLLEPLELRRVVSLAQRWRMTTIVQVSNADELAYAAHLSPHVIGIGTGVEFDRDIDLELMRPSYAICPL